MRIQESKLRQIIREEIRNFEFHDSISRPPKTHGVPDKFIVVFTPHSENSVLDDVVVKTNFSGLYHIGRGTELGAGGEIDSVYSVDKKQEALKRGKRVLEIHGVIEDIKKLNAGDIVETPYGDGEIIEIQMPDDVVVKTKREGEKTFDISRITRRD